MKIDTSNPEFYFAFFYVLSFLVTLVLFIAFSRRLKIPLRSVLLLLTTVSLCTIVGSRLSTIPLSEWGQIISTGQFEGYQGRYAVGGLLFGLAGLILAQKFLGVNRSIINLYAWIAPIGFGIQKIGCLINGCCYGKLSELPWSIKYPIGTNAHFHQWYIGLIDEKASYSQSINPVQLYEAILLFGIAFIVWKSQKFWKKGWSTLIFSLSLFFIVRFFIEFLRDPSSSQFIISSIRGISLVQWFLLIMGLAGSVLLLLCEKDLIPFTQKLPTTQPTIRKSLLYVLSISAVIYIFRGIFTPFELFSLNIKFIPAVLLIAYYVLRSLKEVRFQLATTSFFVLPLFLIAQTLLPDSTKSESVRDFYNEVKSYKRVDFNTSFGDFYGTVKYNPHEGDCGTIYTNEDYKYSYWIAGGGYSSIKKEGVLITTKGINLYGGINKENNLTKQWEKTDFLIGVNPYIKYDLKWVGFGVGAHVGNIRWVPGSPINKPEFDRGTRFSPILPEMLLRVGRRDILDLQYTYGFYLPASIPVLLHELSIGSGFGFKSDYNLRVGTAVSENYATAFISAEALLNKNFGLTLKYNFRGDDFYFSSNYTESVERHGRILFGANYRFGFTR